MTNAVIYPYNTLRLGKLKTLSIKQYISTTLQPNISCRDHKCLWGMV